MCTLAWIVASGLAMGAISLVGSVTLLLSETTQRRITRPLVAFAAGSLLGGVVSWAAAERFDTSWLLGFAAGNFLHIGASDLVPEVNRHRDLRMGTLHFLAFAAGAGLLAALKLVVGA